MRHKRVINTQMLLSVIPKGKRNAIHLEELANRLGLSPRDTKAAVKAARRRHVICSGQCGYWLPETRIECESFITMMCRQAKSRFVTIKHIKAELAKIPEQIELDTTEKDSEVK